MRREFLILRGSHYEINYQIGKHFKKSIKESARLIDVAGNIKLLNSALEFFKTHYPSIYDEFAGRAAGAEISIQEYIAICTYELWFKKIAKCTDLYFCLDGKQIIHNEDGYCSTKFLRLFCVYPDECVFDLCGYDTLHGSTFSSNKYLSFSINHIYNDNYNFDGGISGYLIGRIIISCKDLQEVKNVLKNVDISGSISINLYINKTNKMYSIEKVLNKFEIKEINQTFFRTNHIVHEKLFNMVKLPKSVNTSFTRYEILKQKINKVHTVNDAINLMLYYNGNIYESVFQGNRTRATVLFNNKEITFIDKFGNKSQNYLNILKDLE